MVADFSAGGATSGYICDLTLPCVDSSSFVYFEDSTISTVVLFGTHWLYYSKQRRRLFSEEGKDSAPINDERFGIADFNE